MSNLDQEMRSQKTQVGSGLKDERGNNMEEGEGWGSRHSLVGTGLAKFKQKYQSELTYTHILVRAGDI